MTKIQIFDDIISSEIKNIEDQIEQIDIQMDKINDERDILLRNIADLAVKKTSRIADLNRIKAQGTRLKKFVWTSDNPNIVALRNEILIAAKMIQEPAKT